MESKIVEISGYIGAFSALYMTKRNCTEERLNDIIEVVNGATTRQGFFIKESPYAERFLKYMNSIIKYGIQKEHETLLDYINITTVTYGLHRGAQDDFDSHARRMTIIRTSSRYNEFEKTPEVSDWYKDKIIPFYDLANSYNLPPSFMKGGIIWVMTQWGYVREDLVKNGDVCRGQVTLAVASDNTAMMSFRNWRHVFDLRRFGSHAAPELQEMVETVREDMRTKMPPLGETLGQVWVPQVGFVEKNTAEYKKTE